MSLPMPQRRPRRRRPGRRTMWLAAAAAAAAAATAAAVLLLTSSRPPSGKAPGQPPLPPRSDSRVPSRAAGGGIAVSTAGWRAATLDGAVVPESPADGPARTAGSLASGFADTPAGAVLAAVNTAVRVSGQLGPDVFAPTISTQVTGSAAQDLLNAAWDEYGQASAQQQPKTVGGPAGAADAAVIAFRLTAWTPQAASVTVASQAEGTASAEVTVTLQVRWVSGDWRLVAPAGGAFTATSARAGVPAGFTQLPKAVTP